ncbi:MAG: hypothetical protein WC028_18520 [Candidatus Obscuribacterales bacterium]
MTFKRINELAVDYLTELALNDGFERTELGLSRNLESSQITASYQIVLLPAEAIFGQIVSKKGEVAFLIVVRWEELEAIVQQIATADFEIGPFTFATATNMLTKLPRAQRKLKAATAEQSYKEVILAVYQELRKSGENALTNLCTQKQLLHQFKKPVRIFSTPVQNLREVAVSLYARDLEEARSSVGFFNYTSPQFAALNLGAKLDDIMEAIAPAKS